ncbi:MAG: uroporphyrinogen decarboxylase family protein [Bdellovibrionales bacterium]
MNVRFQNALKGIPQNTPPVWFMRQAGRYHAHYQRLRAAHSFMELCKQPKLACEVAMGPIEDFDFDVAILFSDLLFPLEALGMGLSYEPSPQLEMKLNPENLKKLRPFKQAIVDLQFQKEAMQLTRKTLPSNKSLIGFVGGPWTLFSYAVEGEHKGHLIPAKSNFKLYTQFCEQLMPLLEANIGLQLEGGAEVVMLFDTAAGELSPLIFQELVQGHILQLAHKFPGKLGYYSKGTVPAHIARLRQDTAFAGFGIDHRWDLPAELIDNANGFLQGNFDQALLFLPEDDFRKQMDLYLNTFSRLTPLQRRHWVSGLGHGVLPATPEKNVRNFVKHVREVFG